MARKKTKQRKIKPKKLKKNLTMDDFKDVKQMLFENLQKDGKKELKEAELAEGSMEVDELNKYEALNRIDDIIKHMVKSIKIKGETAFKVPQRSASNIIY